MKYVIELNDGETTKQGLIESGNPQSAIRKFSERTDIGRDGEVILVNEDGDMWVFSYYTEDDKNVFEKQSKYKKKYNTEIVNQLMRGKKEL